MTIDDKAIVSEPPLENRDKLTPNTEDRQKLTRYRTTLQQRQTTEKSILARRFQQAEEVAEQAATLLKEKFGAERVMVFGSLVHKCWFSNTSDLDLAVWGLDNLTYLNAVAKLQDLSSEFKIDLVRMESCKPALEKSILQEGLINSD
jgi:predicted nucleotidyltransferase